MYVLLCNLHVRNESQWYFQLVTYTVSPEYVVYFQMRNKYLQLGPGLKKVGKIGKLLTRKFGHLEGNFHFSNKEMHKK